MKFYNPFKWHLFKSEYTNIWYIRRFDLLFLRWQYLDELHDTWYILSNVIRYCGFENEEKAISALNKRKQL
jgi:hypothetical protein